MKLLFTCTKNSAIADQSRDALCQSKKIVNRLKNVKNAD